MKYKKHVCYREIIPALRLDTCKVTECKFFVFVDELITLFPTMVLHRHSCSGMYMDMNAS